MTDEPLPVFSRAETRAVQPPGSPRTYTMAPPTYLERQALRADLTRTAGANPSQPQMFDAIRAAIREIAAANAAELLAVVDAAEAAPEDRDTQARLAAIEAAVGTVPVYAELRAARERFAGAMPYIAARHLLRGWDGPQLPAFRRVNGLVPDHLLDLLPIDEITAIGWAGWDLMQVGPSAEKNSAAPSPSPATPETSPEG
jgi:hypothetical protein